MKLSFDVDLCVRTLKPPPLALVPLPPPRATLPFLHRFLEGFVAVVILAPLIKGQQPRSPVPPPSSFPSGFKPAVASGTNTRLALPNIQAQQRRGSRPDLDFEEALASPDTIQLRESVDIFSPEFDTSILLTPSPRHSSLYGNSPGASGKYEGSNGSPSPNPRGRNTVAPSRQPGTPNVIPATPTPPRPSPSSVLILPPVLTPSTSSSSNSTPFHTPLTSPDPSCDGEHRTFSVGVQPSPLEGIHPLPCDAEEDEHQTKQQSMYRSPGSASSPDLVTLLKKTKQRGGSSNQSSNVVGNRDALRPDTLEARNSGGSGQESSSRRLRTTSATPSLTSSTSAQQKGLRPRADRIATTNSSSSSFQRTEDSSNFLSARSPDWVLPNPSTSPAPSPSVLKVRFPPLFTKPENWYLTFIQTARSTVRARTTAFLGKMWGQSTVRDRSVREISARQTTISFSDIRDQAHYQWFSPRFVNIRRLFRCSSPARPPVTQQRTPNLHLGRVW